MTDCGTPPTTLSKEHRIPMHNRETIRSTVILTKSKYSYDNRVDYYNYLTIQAETSAL